MSNSSAPNPPTRSGGLSLYANLLDPTNASTPGSITKGPVVFKTPAADATDEASAKKPQIDAGRFLPFGCL
jgi:splicing factor 45